MHVICYVKSDLIFVNKIVISCINYYHVQVTYDALPTKRKERKKKEDQKPIRFCGVQLDTTIACIKCNLTFKNRTIILGTFLLDSIVMIQIHDTYYSF